MKKIALGNLGEFWYGDYKEPFVQQEGAVPGYPHGVLLYDHDLKPACALCGKTFHSLALHANQKHGLPASEYKREMGLRQVTSLVSEHRRQHYMALGLRSTARGGLPTRFVEQQHGGSRAKGTSNGMHLEEVRNKSGRCYAQAIEIGKSLLATGRPITTATLRGKGIGRGTLTTLFGDINGFRRVCGDPKVNHLVGRADHSYTDGELISVLRNAGLSLGRTPTTSDLKRLGLPSDTAFRNHFGNYSEACRRAGLQVNVPMARPTTEDEMLAIVSTYASTGSHTKTREVVGVSMDRVMRLLRSFGIEPVHYKNPLRRRQMDAAVRIARRLAGYDELTPAA